MNWWVYVPGVVGFVIGVVFGMLILKMIRNHLNKHDPFIPEIPFVRVGSPVFIGEDMYYLASYQYDVDDLNTQGRRTVIFQSVSSTKEFENHE